MKPIVFVVIVCLGIVFSICFYNQQPGLNVILFEAPLVAAMLYFYPTAFRHNSARFILAGFLAGAISIVVVNTALTLIVHLLYFTMLGGLVVGHAIKNPLLLLGSGFEKFWHLASLPFKKTVPQPGQNIKPSYVFRLSVWPLLVVLLFALLYSFAVPRFGNAIRQWFSEVNFIMLGLFVLGSSIAAVLLVMPLAGYSSTWDSQSIDDKLRSRIRRKINTLSTGLKKENISSVIMLSGLNLLILSINSLDISTYWFSYSPQGYEEMKQLVHSGTYLLIFCILLSIIVVLYVYRGNLNFYSKNRWLQYLAVAWLVQNGLMVLSVAWRNYWYIQSYNLAYKRIGVLLFLAATLVGIITTIIKIREQKSTYYLLRVNSSFAFMVLLLAAFVNWDAVIAQYNLAHKNSAYVHKNFLVDLDDSALPALITNLDYFDTPIENEPGYAHLQYKYPKTITYKQLIQQKLSAFHNAQKNKHWLSWNYKDLRVLQHIDKQQ